MIRKTWAWILLAGLTAAAAGAQTTDELIAKNIEARGGKDRIKAVKSLRMSGRMNAGEGRVAQFKTELVRPDKMRNETTFQGETRVQLFNGKTGWVMMGGEAQPIPEEAAASMAAQADFDGPLVDAQEKGNRVEFAGKADVDGKPAYKLKVTKKNGDVEYHYLDAARYLETKVEGRSKAGDREVEGETTLGDYRTVDGVAYPFRIESKQKGAPSGMTVTIDKIDVNPDLPPSRFEKTAPQPHP
jgi:outer membrane lipoprotein-sorting protein